MVFDPSEAAANIVLVFTNTPPPEIVIFPDEEAYAQYPIPGVKNAGLK